MKDPRIGVYVCHCGTNISKMVDVDLVAARIGEMPNVVVSRAYKYMCSDPGQELIIQDIKEHNLNRIVVAACSPRIHESTFRKVLEKAGLNPYMFHMANIREQVSWVHSDREAATWKSLSLIAGAVRRVGFHEELQKRSVPVHPATLIIGGGVAGLSAAMILAEAGKKVYLIEKNGSLGGNAAQIALTYPYLDSPKVKVRELIRQAQAHPKIEVYTNSELGDLKGYIGNFQAAILQNGQEHTLVFGHIILAIGVKPFDPVVVPEYGYGELPDVLTSMEYERMLETGRIETRSGKIPKHVAIVHCVGSRNTNYHEYCSRICCLTALKFSAMTKSCLPDTQVYQLYGDMRAIGKSNEEFYDAVARKGVVFMMFDQQSDLPRIRISNHGGPSMFLRVNEKLSGETVDVPADLVVLMTAVEAGCDARNLGQKVGVSLCGNQFFIEKHPKLDPVATTTDGVYVVGACQGPKMIFNSVIQAKAASARVLATIARGQVAVEVTTAHAREEICCGCRTCIRVCPYGAISFDEERNVSVVNEVVCKGCGTCGSSCPTGAIRSRHFTDEQIFSQIEGLMNMQSKIGEVIL
jgi:heterodisulfide reductase subunit A2